MEVLIVHINHDNRNKYHSTYAFYLEGKMKLIEKVILKALEKVSREFIESEKAGSSHCSCVFFQPTRSTENKKEKWSKL